MYSSSPGGEREHENQAHRVLIYLEVRIATGTDIDVKK